MSMTNRKPMMMAREARRFREEAGNKSRIKSYRYYYTAGNGKEFLDVYFSKAAPDKARANLEAMLKKQELTLVSFEPR